MASPQTGRQAGLALPQSRGRRDGAGNDQREQLRRRSPATTRSDAPKTGHCSTGRPPPAASASRRPLPTPRVVRTTTTLVVRLVRTSSPDPGRTRWAEDLPAVPRSFRPRHRSPTPPWSSPERAPSWGRPLPSRLAEQASTLGPGGRRSHSCARAAGRGSGGRVARAWWCERSDLRSRPPRGSGLADAAGEGTDLPPVGIWVHAVTHGEPAGWTGAPGSVGAPATGRRPGPRAPGPRLGAGNGAAPAAEAAVGGEHRRPAALGTGAAPCGDPALPGGPCRVAARGGGGDRGDGHPGLPRSRGARGPVAGGADDAGGAPRLASVGGVAGAGGQRGAGRASRGDARAWCRASRCARRCGWRPSFRGRCVWRSSRPPRPVGGPPARRQKLPVRMALPLLH